MDAGVVSTTVSLPGALNPERAWVDTTLEARLEWRVLSRLSLELAGGAMAPLTRDQFAFEPNISSTAYQAPAATAVGSIGALLFFL